MGGVKTIDMRAHGTQKLWQKSCAYTKQKHKHMASKTESIAMCKTGHAANKETHKPRSHKTWQTWKHENRTVPYSEKHKLRAIQNKTKQEKSKQRQQMHMDKGAHGPSEL